MIGVDWGTSSFRAFRLDGSTITARREAPLGILRVATGDFAQALRAQIGDWLADGETRILLCGMVGSRQGWQEAPYLRCPADAASLADALVPVAFEGASVRMVPGLTDHDANDVPEVMRGEETQLIGVMSAIGERGLACLPGSHSKWARIEGGQIAGFTTHLTGEAFSALARHTILSRMIVEASEDADGFARGVARAGDAGGLLHHLFGVRALGLFAGLTEASAGSYLSGLLIGHEIRAELPAGATVHLIGAGALCALYATAIGLLGGQAHLQDTDAAARGLATIGELAAWD